MKFIKKLLKGVGIFCGNLCTGRGTYPPCQIMWCRGCYANQSNDVLPNGEKEVEGCWEGGRESVYEAGRNEDHMITHFQCDIFHLRNIKGSSLDVSNLKDKTINETIKRASFNAFWISLL